MDALSRSLRAQLSRKGLPLWTTWWLPVVLLALLAPATAEGLIQNWIPIGPPGKPNITAIAAIGLTVYIATDNGVLRTFDRGQTWESINSGLSNTSVTSLAAWGFSCPAPCASPSVTVLFAGTRGGGVFKGDGTSWTAVNSGLANLFVTSIAGFPPPSGLSLPSTVYAATDGGGMFRSDNGGASWTPATVGQPSLQAATALAVDPSTPLTVYAGGNAGGLYKTSDGGQTWLKTSLEPDFVPVGAIGADPVVPSTVFAALSVGQGIPFCVEPPAPPNTFRSADAGTTWGQVDPAETSCFAFDPRSPVPKVYAGGGGVCLVPEAVSESADGGISWLTGGTGLLFYPKIKGLAVDASGLVYAGVPGVGVFVGGCDSAGNALCLNQGRFEATVHWGLSSSESAGTAYPITDNTGAFWFFDPTNLELAVKVLDGRSINGKFWVFYGSLTNVQFTLTVTDTFTGAVRTYTNPQGTLASVADTSAF